MPTYGIEIDADEFRPERSVVGELERTGRGNIAMRVGRETPGTGPRPWQQTEHIVLTPRETRRLALEMLRMVPVFTVRSPLDEGVAHLGTRNLDAHEAVKSLAERTGRDVADLLRAVRDLSPGEAHDFDPVVAHGHTRIETGFHRARVERIADPDIPTL